MQQKKIQGIGELYKVLDSLFAKNELKDYSYPHFMQLVRQGKPLSEISMFDLVEIDSLPFIGDTAVGSKPTVLESFKNGVIKIKLLKDFSWLYLIGKKEEEVIAHTILIYFKEKLFCDSINILEKLRSTAAISFRTPPDKIILFLGIGRMDLLDRNDIYEKLHLAYKYKREPSYLGIKHKKSIDVDSMSLSSIELLKRIKAKLFEMDHLIGMESRLILIDTSYVGHGGDSMSCSRKPYSKIKDILSKINLLKNRELPPPTSITFTLNSTLSQGDLNCLDKDIEFFLDSFIRAQPGFRKGTSSMRSFKLGKNVFHTVGLITQEKNLVEIFEISVVPRNNIWTGTMEGFYLASAQRKRSVSAEARSKKRAQAEKMFFTYNIELRCELKGQCSEFGGDPADVKINVIEQSSNIESRFPTLAASFKNDILSKLVDFLKIKYDNK